MGFAATTTCLIAQHLCLAFLCMCVNALPFDLNLESTLRSSLMLTYDPKVRPRSYTEVNMTLVLISLNDLKIGDQYMSTTSILYAEWLDERLQWDPVLTGVDGLAFDATEVWVPPLIVDNAVSDMKLVGHDNIPFRAFPSGWILWTPPVIFETSCEMNVLYFPFEMQTCSINLMLYAHTTTEVGIHTRSTEDAISDRFYSSNTIWEYEGGYETEDFMSDIHGSYKILKFNLQFRRRWLFLALNLLLPTIMNSLLMLGVFFLSTESGEKMGYTLTVLLSYFVLLTLLAESLPEVSTHISLLQGYLAVVLVVGCLSTLLTIWVISVFNKDDEREPMTPATKDLVKWALLPIDTLTFWRVQLQCRTNWRKNSRKNNKVSDDTDAWDDSESTSRNWSSEATSQTTLTPIPSMAYYEPASDRTSFSSSENIVDKSDLLTSKQRRDTTMMSSGFNASLALRAKSSSTSSGASGTKASYGSTLYGERSSSQPPKPITANTVGEVEEKNDLDKILDTLTWKDVANYMDSFFLRCLGSILLLFTALLVTVLYIQY